MRRWLCWVGPEAGDGLVTRWGEDRRVAAPLLAPNLRPDPPHGPAHGKGEGLSRGSSAGKVQGRHRRCGNARLRAGDGAVGAAGWGSPGARASPGYGNTGGRLPLQHPPWAHSFL